MPAVVSWILAIGAALLVLAALYYWALPWTVQWQLWLLLWLRYRLRVRGLENVPKTGPVLMAPNHMGWFDGFFLAATSPRSGRALVNAGFIDRPILRHVARRAGLIPVYYGGPRGKRAMIQACRDTLDKGEAIGVFPEGQISRNGLTGPFQRGLEVILSGREHIPVVPVYLDNVWGSTLSFSGGRFFKKWPKGLRRTINIYYGPPVKPPVTAFSVRQGVLEAGVRAIESAGLTQRQVDTIDLSLPHYRHPDLGLLTGSTADYNGADVKHLGHKPGTVGVPLPGVAIRAVDASGTALGQDEEGALQALVPGRANWTDLGERGLIDRDGFVTLVGRDGADEAVSKALAD